MPANWEKTVQTKAPLSEAMGFYMDVENIAKVHSSFVKEVKILSRDDNTVTIEQRAAVMGRNLRSVCKITFNRTANTLVQEYLEGDGKGSIINVALKSIPTGTEVHFAASMELGGLGFFIKGPAKKTFENTVDEDIKALDALP